MLKQSVKQQKFVQDAEIKIIRGRRFNSDEVKCFVQTIAFANATGDVNRQLDWQCGEATFQGGRCVERNIT